MNPSPDTRCCECGHWESRHPDYKGDTGCNVGGCECMTFNPIPATLEKCCPDCRTALTDMYSCKNRRCVCHQLRKPQPEKEWSCKWCGGTNDTEPPFGEKPHPAPWSERFDEEFPAMGISGDPKDECIYRHDQYVNDNSLLKSFIAKEIEEAEKRGKRDALRKIDALAAEFADDPKCLAIIGEYVGEALFNLAARKSSSL